MIPIMIIKQAIVMKNHFITCFSRILCFFTSYLFFDLISKVKPGRKFTEWLFTRTRRKGKSIEKYEEIGLVVFVGIPLPGTGGWTGALAANIFGLRFWRSMLFIFLGVIMAAIIVTALSLMGTLAL